MLKGASEGVVYARLYRGRLLVYVPTVLRLAEWVSTARPGKSCIGIRWPGGRFLRRYELEEARGRRDGLGAIESR